MKNRQLVKTLCFGMAFFILLSCVNTPKARAATATLLTSNISSLSTTTQVVIGSNIFFVATGASAGEELWKIDTSTNTTSLVKDIYSGSSSSSPSDLTAVGSSLFFIAENGTHGRELWKSDGTENGTVLVKDILSGAGSSASSGTSLASISGVAFFRADDGVNGVELWKSDGTENGTVLIKDMEPGSNKGTPYSSNPRNFINNNGIALFAGYDSTNGRELWKSDGTTNGTVLVKDIVSGSSISDPTMLASINGVVFFTAADSAGRELWKSDGTENGTVMVKDIYSGASSSDPGRTQYATQAYGVHNNELYFAADDGTNGWELWKSDGTTNGTVLVKDIYSGASSGEPGLQYNDGFISFGSYLYFSARSSQNDYELWRSDGTENGTTLVKDILLGSEGGFVGSRFFLHGSKIYFSAWSNVGWELWNSDGTADGTSFVIDINTGSPSAFPWPIAAVGDVIYVVGSNTPTFTGSYAYWSVDTTVTAAGGRSYADTTPPDAPTKFTATSDGKTVTLNWAGPTASDVTRIEILRNTGGSSAVDGGTPIDVLKIGTTTFTDTNVIPGETYTYIIRPRDGAGNLAVTEEVKVKVEAPKPAEVVAPSAPTTPAPTPSTPVTPVAPVLPEAVITPVAPPIFTQQDFFINGTPATKTLGQREREALWRDYVAVYDTEPTASALDVMATGQVPLVDIAAEKSQAKNVLPYWRAITGKRTLVPVSTWGFSVYNTLVYRLRYERDLKKEAVGIKQFKKTFRRNPATPVEWASVRAWAYIK